MLNMFRRPTDPAEYNYLYAVPGAALVASYAAGHLSGKDNCCSHGLQQALLSPKTSVLIQKRHPYTGNLNRETSGDSTNAFLHCGDVSALVL